MSLELPYQILNLFMVLTLSTTEGQADPLPAPAYKYEMKHAIQSLLLLSTGIIQIPASCNTRDNDDGSTQHTSPSRSRPVGNKDISGPLWANLSG